MFTNKKREGTNRFVCDVSLYVAETPKASIKYHKSPLPIIPFGIASYGFVGNLSRNSRMVSKGNALKAQLCVAADKCTCYSDMGGGSVAEWFRALVLQSGGPGFKASTLSLAEFVSR